MYFTYLTLLTFFIFINKVFSLSESTSNVNSTFKISRHLVPDDNYMVSWNVDDSTNEILFKIIVRTHGYVGFGISLNGGMNGADIVILRATDPPVLEDFHGIGNEAPVPDVSQDWNLLSAIRNSTHTTMEISRLLNTGDEAEDLEITTDTLRLIWAYGAETRSGMSYHGLRRGQVSVNFLDPAVETLSVDEMEKKYKVWKTQKRVSVAANDTVYMCSFFKSPHTNQKQHIVGFGMHIDLPQHRRHLHHADLYKCAAPAGEDPATFFAPFLGDGYDCNYSPIPFPYEHCGLFEFQWTIGGGITMFPDNLGMPIEGGEIYMTEVHFDNPEKRGDLEITAGFNIYYTPDLKETEVGHLQLGVMTNKTYSVTVPPNSTDFVVSSHCPMDCTSSIPPEGITVFTYLLHSHLSGRKLKLRHFRHNVELPPIAKDDLFDFKYQNNRRLRNSIVILPGDHLTMECTYDTKWKHGKVTLGGRSPRDEMCQAFLLYYPRMSQINSCGSYHSQKKIVEYMGLTSVSQFQGEIDATVLGPEAFAGLKYSEVIEKRIRWTAEKRVEYEKMIRFGEQQAYCTPLHYYNQSFVMTNYPLLQPIHTNSAFFSFSSNYPFYVSLLLLAVILSAIIVYIIRQKKNVHNDQK